MLRFTLFCVWLFVSSSSADRRITFKNRCSQAVWISPLTNAQGAPIGNIQKLNQQQEYSYIVPDSGWGGRFWPKTGCDGSGQNCQVGQSIPPCPSNGCQAPAETKVEFFYPEVDSRSTVWYDVSLVDGYSLPMEIKPSQTVSGKQCLSNVRPNRFFAREERASPRIATFHWAIARPERTMWETSESFKTTASCSVCRRARNGTSPCTRTRRKELDWTIAARRRPSQSSSAAPAEWSEANTSNWSTGPARAPTATRTMTRAAFTTARIRPASSSIFAKSRLILE